MRRIYTLLLHFHDPELRQEMLDLHMLCAAEERARGRLAYVRFCSAELSGLIPPQPWIATVTLGIGLSLLAISGQGEVADSDTGYRSHLLHGPCAAKVPVEHPRELMQVCRVDLAW